MKKETANTFHLPSVEDNQKRKNNKFQRKRTNIQIQTLNSISFAKQKQKVISESKQMNVLTEFLLFSSAKTKQNERHSDKN